MISLLDCNSSFKSNIVILEFFLSSSQGCWDFARNVNHVNHKQSLHPSAVDRHSFPSSADELPLSSFDGCSWLTIAAWMRRSEGASILLPTTFVVIIVGGDRAEENLLQSRPAWQELSNTSGDERGRLR